MRIRFKPWAREELETSPFYIDNPKEYKNKWKTAFENSNELRLELGCGKGNFVSQSAIENPNINYIAVDLIDAMLGMAKRNIEVAYGIRKSTDKEEIENEIEKQKVVKNIKLVRFDISNISEILGEDDEIKRIYINFCNPWPKGKHHKKRLTFDRNLIAYKKILKGEIYFKTDDDELFKASLEYFENAGYDIISKTYDLHAEENFWKDQRNVDTEHEKMFTTEGIKIKALIAKLK